MKKTRSPNTLHHLRSPVFTCRRSCSTRIERVGIGRAFVLNRVRAAFDRAVRLQPGLVRGRRHLRFSVGASPGTQTKHTTLLFCMSWCPDFEFRGTQAIDVGMSESDGAFFH